MVEPAALHLMIGIEWAAPLMLAFPPVAGSINAEPEILENLTRRGRVALQEQLTMLKASLLMTDRTAIHVCPDMDSKHEDEPVRPDPLQIVDIATHLAESTDHELLPLAHEFARVLQTDHVVAFDSVVKRFLTEDLPPAYFDDCVPLQYAVAELRKGVPAEELLYTHRAAASDHEVFRRFSLSTIFGLWMLSHPSTSLPLLDSRSSDEVGPTLTAFRKRSASSALIALQIAPLYAIRAFPNLNELSVEQILEWRGEVVDSTNAFREHLKEWLDSASEITTQQEATRFLESIGPVLDSDYLDVHRQVQSSKLWRVTRASAPGFGGAAVGAAVGLAAAGFGPVASLASVGGLTLSQAVTVVLTTLQRKRALMKEPMYWRFRVPATD